MSHIELVPGVYRKRPSYIKLIKLKADIGFNLNKRNHIQDITQAGLSATCLSFTFPLQKIPDRFEQWSAQFFARVPEVGRNTENANKFPQRQNTVRRILKSLDIEWTYDSILIVYATLLSIRRPLPYT